MNSLSQLTPAVRVDTKRCQAVATRLEAFNFPSAAEDAPLAGIAQPLLPNTYFLAVAICHQTSPRNAQRLGGYLDSGQEAGGWDFLRLRLAERIAQNPELATPALWVTIDEQRLGDLFSDARGQRTLSDVGARATLVRDLGVTLRAQGIETVGTIFDQEGGNLEQGGMGLLPRLERFRAYRDPIRKKSFFSWN